MQFSISKKENRLKTLEVYETGQKTALTTRMISRSCGMGNHSGISRGRRDNLDKLLASEQLMRKLDDDTYRICRLFIMSYRQPIYLLLIIRLKTYFPQGFKKFYPRSISAELK